MSSGNLLNESKVKAVMRNGDSDDQYGVELQCYCLTHHILHHGYMRER